MKYENCSNEVCTHINKAVFEVAKEPVRITISHPNYEYAHGKKLKNPKWIVVHYTACINVGARAMCRAMRNNNDASSHFYIDENEICSAVPLEYIAWHVGNGKCKQPSANKTMSLKELSNYKAKDWRYDLAAKNHLEWQSNGDDFLGNSVSIGLDICCKKLDAKNNRSATATDWYFEDEAVENAAKTVAYLANRYSIELSHIIRHCDATGKLCPQSFAWPPEIGDKKWEAFKEKVAEYIKSNVIAEWI